MKMNLFKNFVGTLILITLTTAFLCGCGKSDTANSPSASPDASGSPSSSDGASDEDKSYDDAEKTTAYVAKMGEIPFYESQYYYFLYTALSEAYYGSDEFKKLGTDEYSDKTEDERFEDFVEFFNEKADGSEKTNLQLAAERALEICHTSNISALRGQENNLVTKEKVDELIAELDSIADQYSEYYKQTRDECMKSMYGMNVNDLKEYTALQSYGNAYVSKWKADNGYVFDEKEPTKPTKPTEPGKDATDEDVAKYEEKLQEYDEALADYNDELKAYNERKEAFWEQFREAYNKGVEAYRIVSVRYLYVSTLDDEGKLLSDSEKLIKKNEIESYAKLSSEYGYDFEKVVKGFSESDESICDIDIAKASDTPFNEDIIVWASETAKVSDEIKIFETKDGYYAVQIVGVTDFDKTVGVVADSEKVASSENIRETVAYYYLNDLYNQYVTMLTEEDEYKLSDINYERMYELAEEYLNDTGEEDLTTESK